MSEANELLLKNLLSASSPEQMLVLATLDNLAGLPPETADAAYRCTLVHWFNEDIIAFLMTEGEPQKIGRAFDRQQKADAGAIYAELKMLPFVEEFPGRGYRFHDLTRQTLLDYLWREENEFYKTVSQLAVDYFNEELDKAFDPTQEVEGTDWDLLVEGIYHLLVADELAALDELPEYLDEFMAWGLVGKCHALVQAAEEHSDAGRLSPETVIMVRFWRSHVAYLTNDYAQVETIAHEIMAKNEEDVPPGVLATVGRYWTDSLRFQARYEEAYEQYKKLLEKADDVELDPKIKIDALLGLGKIFEIRSDFPAAEDIYKQALVTAVRMSVVQDFEQVDEEVITHIGLSPDVPLPPTLHLYEPESWQPITFFLSNKEDEAPADNGHDSDSEEVSILLYSIGIFDGETTDAAPLPAADEAEDMPIEMVLILPEIIHADIWLRFGYLYQFQDEYDLAAACARLAQQIYEVVDDLFGMQQALQLLQALGAATGDLELTEISVDYQHIVLDLAREKKDRRAELESLLSLASAYWGREAFAESRENYDEASSLARELGDSGSLAVALEGLGRLDWTAGEMNTAEERIQNALALYRQLGHREGEARLLNLLASFELGRYQSKAAFDYIHDSLELYQELRIPFGHMDALITLSEIYQFDEAYQDALSTYQAALKLAKQPSDKAKILNGIGFVYRLMEKFESAAGIYLEALELSRASGRLGTQGDILLGRGYVGLGQHKYDEAHEFFMQADDVFTRLDSRNGRLSVMFGLVALYQAWKKGEKAVSLSEETVAYATDLGDLSQVRRARRSLAQSLELVHDLDQALVILDEALELGPDDPVTLAAKGDLLVSRGEYQKAVAVYEQSLELDKNNSSIWDLRGWALQYMDPPLIDEAMTSYETAVAYKPDNLWAHKGIGNLLRLTGRLEEAKEKFLWIVDELKAAEILDDADFSLLGWCYYSLGQYDEAIKWLTRAISRDQEVISDQFDLALCYLCLGKEEEAVERYKQLIVTLRQRQIAARRDPLIIALVDLMHAKDFLPSLKQSSEAQMIQRLLEDALQEIGVS